MIDTPIKMYAKLKSLAGSLVLALLLIGGALMLLGAGDSGPRPVLAATQTTGGPDDFGYVYTDSLTTPALYNWVDIAASGTLVGFNDPDTAVKQLNLPDMFSFYGNTYNRLYVTTNGYASFPTVYASYIVTQCHPTERQPPDSMAALCTDFVGDTVYYSTTTAYNGHETLIIQYDSVTHTVSGLTTTFQIILDFEDDAIIYQYHTLPATPGVTATVGIIGYAANQEDYLVYCQGDAGCPPQEGLTVRFSLSPPPLLELMLTPNDYFPDVGETIMYTLVLSNSGALASGAVLTNVLPAGLDYVSGTLQATDGTPTYQAAVRTIHWQGDLTTRTPVTLTYAATLNTGDASYNRARLSHPLARRDATAVSSPAEPWDDPGPLDAPRKFDHRLGTWRHIAVDDAGTLHVAYAGAGLYYATLSGTTWLSETVPVTTYNLSHATLTLDDQNRALIAFYGQQRLWLARQTDAGWTVEEIAEIGWVGDNFALDLARSSDGALHLVYNEQGYSTDSLHYTAYDGADWLTPTVAIPYPDCYAYDAGFSLALDADDVPHIACTYRGSTPHELRVYTYTAAAPWTGYTTVVSGADLYYDPSLVFDGDTPHLGFFQGSRALYHAAHDGADWQVTLVDDSAPTPYLRQGAALGINGGQVGILGALRAGSSGNYTLTVQYAARPLTATTWVTGTALTLTYSRNDPRPALALDGAGQAHLVYYDSRDQTLRYAAETEGFAPTMADESRALGRAAIAMGVDGAIHVAWDSKGLRYAIGAADAPTWTRQMAVLEPEVSYPALALAVDGADTPHLLYGERDTPLYHATPTTDSTWITRVVGLPGDVVGFDISAEVTSTAHVAYLAVQGDDHVLRHAAFDGAGWLTETLAVVSPAIWSHDQTPQIVAQGGQVYVLYADCTQNPDDSSDYPIALRLATWDGGDWAHDTLYEFIGQCNWQLTYQLAGDTEGRLSAVAHINGDAVRPRPLVVTFWIADAAGQRQVTQRQLFATTGDAGAPASAQPAGVQAPAMMSYIIQAMLRGDGGLATWIEYGTRIIQQWDREGNLSGKIPEETGSSSVAIEAGDGDGERSVVVEKWEYENELRVPRSVRRPCAECCLHTQVQPAEAADDGCTATPSNTQGACGAQVEVMAGGCDGWKFTHWSGAATGSDATTLADMTGAAPDCSVATAHFAEEEAVALKVAEITGAAPITATSKETVYPNDTVAYSVKLSWKGPDEAVISLTDEYPRPRVDYIQGTVEMGPWIHGCAVADSITCNGQFPSSEEIVSTYVAFETVATCDLYRTEDPAGPLVNLARVQIGDYQFQPQVNNDVAVPFLLKSSTPHFMPQSAFAPGHNVLLYTIPKGNEPDCCTACALDVYVVVDGDTDHPHLMKNDGAGVNDRAQADFIANDCHHALWFEPTEDRAYQLELYVVKRGDPFAPLYLADTLTLEPAATPELAVYTDLRELYKEFNETQANSASDDDNDNCIRDYYDALARIVEYAGAHKGVVVDVRQDAYDQDYVYNNTDDRAAMGNIIDWLVSKMPEAKLKYLALIGDDAVLPFYRYPDPLNDAPKLRESRYLTATHLGDHGVPTVIDTQAGLLMTDVPYSTRTAATPTTPQPDYAVGRIFAPNPLTLLNMIAGYEQPVVVGARTGSAFTFNIANEYDRYGNLEFAWGTNTDYLAIRPLEAAGYRYPTTSLTDLGKVRYRGWLDGNAKSWHPLDLLKALYKDNNNRLTVLNSHADHLSNMTCYKDITARHIDQLALFPGAVWLNGGCHGGYSTGYDPTTPTTSTWNYYSDALVRAALERQLTYYANTTYGHTTAGKDIRYHDRMHQLHLRYLAYNARTTATTGDVHRWAGVNYTDYASSPLTARDISALYGTILYGLPTQRITRKPSGVMVQAVGSRPDIAAIHATQRVSVSLSAPHFAITTDDAGYTWFEVPHGGELTAVGAGPVVPVLVHNFYLPAGASGLNVTLVASDTTVYPGSVQLPLQQAGNRTFGVETLPFTGTAPYPEQSFWTSTFTDSAGVYVVISAIPLRYAPTTGQVTLIHQMDFAVDYDVAASHVQIDALTVNNGAPVLIDQDTLPITLTLSTTTADPLTLYWVIENQGGAPLRSDSDVFTPTAGTNYVIWHTDSRSWQPGPQVLHVTLEDQTGAVIAAEYETLNALGRSLALVADASVYGASDTQADVHAQVRDESGAPVTELAAAFTQMLDGNPLALNWQEGDGYSATLSLTTLSTGTHTLDVALNDGTAAQLNFTVDRRPPTSTLRSPTIVYSPAITITISGGDDLSGVETYLLQYRVGADGEWTDWLTRTTDWDYDIGAPADLSPIFGPTQPVTLVEGETYDFRVRAIDRAGNVEAIHSIPDTATTYVAAPPCNPPAAVAITGAPTATLSTPATFTATVQPLTSTAFLPMTFPLTYTWQASGLPSQTHVISAMVDTATFTWTVAGPHSITLTVQGLCGEPVSDTHPIIVSGGHSIYLPLVLRNAP